MDYQYYRVLAVLKKVKIEEESVVKMPDAVKRFPFKGEEDKFLIVSSGVEEGDEIERFGKRFPPKDDKTCLRGGTKS